MKNNPIISNLLKDSPNAFRCLHFALGFDFESPFGIIHHSGKYTVNKLIKAAATDGRNLSDLTVIVTKIKDRPWWDEYRVVLVSERGDIDIDIKLPWLDCGRGLDNYITKGDFHETRKSEKADTYILWQEESFLKKPLERKVDISKRYRVIYCTKWRSMQGDVTGISSVDLKEMGASGKKITYNVHGKTTVDIIDKSGYFVFDRRDELKQRAKKLRYDRQKAAFDMTDNSAKVIDLQNRITSKKQEIIEALKAANTFQELQAVEKAVGWYKGLARTVNDFERFKKKVNEKSFASISDCERAYNAIVESLNTKTA